MILSSLSKVLLHEEPTAQINKFTSILNEPVSFQFAYFCDAGKSNLKIVAPEELKITVYAVEHVPIETKQGDDDFIINGGKPGLYPDPLIPISDGDYHVKNSGWNTLWFEVQSDVAGEYNIEITVNGKTEKTSVTIYDCEKPERTFIYTSWFHSDCLATHYDVPVFSEEHWGIIENFIECAAKHGQTMILTPLFTPPLDTEPGSERPTVQLVDVEKVNKKYHFNFDKLDRWIALCDKYGIKYFEFSHLFSQWGAKFAPKIMGKKDGEYVRLFGWETKASGIAYRSFLLQFIPAMHEYIKKRNLADRAYFHVSDEPGFKDLTSYTRAHRSLRPLISKYKHIDALSERAFFAKKLVQIPIPGEEAFHKFDGINIERWIYYCCGPNHGNYSNRFIFHPSLRTRFFGTCMYKYNCVGFLHWGYNFWYTQLSKEEINPYENTTAGGKFPAGDGFVVYPGENGKAYPSIRLKQVRDMLDDYEALKLLEKRMTKYEIDELLPRGLDFNKYPHDDMWLLNLRNKVNFLLKR
ncbi:MAG TPA: DUF4091 domain-containing protein [Clostridiales bacterium]|nr:DUF4091 domain-containing protein [Clostridiales bacterium]